MVNPLVYLPKNFAPSVQNFRRVQDEIIFYADYALQLPQITDPILAVDPEKKVLTTEIQAMVCKKQTDLSAAASEAD